MDNRILVFLAVLASVLVAIFTGTAIASGELVAPAVILIFLAGVGVIARPEITAFASIALYTSSLTLPALPGQMTLSELAMAAVFGCALLQLVFEKTGFPRFTAAHWLLVAFCTVLLFTGWRRGFGFQFLGGAMWGGFNYIKIVLAAFLVLALPGVNMSVGMWRTAILLFGMLAPLSFIADRLVLGGFNLGIINLFIQTSASVGDNLLEQESGGGIGRMQSAGPVASGMLLTLLCLVPTNKIFSFQGLRYQALLVVIFVLSLLSGFRLMTLTLVVIILIVALFQGSLTSNRVVGGILFFLLGLGIIYATASSLPLSVQRAVSWLPGISISSFAESDAEGTVSWRLELWRYAIRFIPDYFWIGKGFSYDAHNFLAAQRGYAAFDPLNWALITGSYHNGYLSLILVTGIFGFLTGLPMMVIVVIRHLRITREPWRDGRLHQYHQVFFASQLCLVVTYLTVYGDVSASFPGFFFFWAVLEALREKDASSLLASLPERESEDYAFVD